MDLTTIVIFFGVIVVLSIIAIMVSQAREKARLERARRATALEDRFKLSQRLLSDIPSQYLSRDLRRMLLLHAEETCQSLEALKTDLPTGEWRQRIRKQREDLEAGGEGPAASRIDSKKKTSDIKIDLEHLYRIIETMQKQGRIDASLAKRNLKVIIYLLHRVQADYHVHQAQEATQNQRYRHAIHAYHMACSALDAVKDHPSAVKALKSFRGRITELEQAAEQQSGDKAGQDRLEKEWDSFLSEDEWKKKADYDD
ncbi:hypothetical protein CF392_04030 [Tamilnaduibacter salinus]|uniref:DNA repair protein n=1 Tax=Tamilnaduibacter salinus TaxID=1484056 RepID=A0A2A2I585_9GAMM|nr:hypothetical protein [Tamilnaduibacter salinus]PAV26742.1 hypothetical protein CF392_04030 [Tamilnaduibacter salinus]